MKPSKSRCDPSMSYGSGATGVMKGFLEAVGKRPSVPILSGLPSSLVTAAYAEGQRVKPFGRELRAERVEAPRP